MTSEEKLNGKRWKREKRKRKRCGDAGRVKIERDRERAKGREKFSGAMWRFTRYQIILRVRHTAP